MKKYNYHKLTITFDLDVEKEAEMMEWLKAHKKKQNSFSTQMKNLLKVAIEEEKAQIKFMASLGKKEGER